MGVNTSVSWRYDAEFARSTMQALVPDSRMRALFEETMARVIERAHAIAPACWTTRMGRAGDLIRLNVGVVQVVRLHKAWATLTMPQDDCRAILARRGEPLYQGSFRQSLGLGWFTYRPDIITEILQESGEALMRAVEIAARSAKQSPYRGAHCPGMVAYLRESLGRPLPDPAYPIDEDNDDEGLSTDRILELVKLRYPGYDGPDHAPFVDEEIRYKQNLVKVAAQSLGQQELDRLVAASEWDEIWKRALKIAQSTNLLYQAVPQQSDLALLHRDGLDRQSFSRELRDLLHGSDPSPDRLERFCRWAEENQLPNKWALPTYFLFASHPEDDILVKPAITRRFLGMLGAEFDLPLAPGAKAYAELLEILGEAAQELGTRDMIELQSILWVAAGEASKQVLSEDQRKRFQELFAEFAGTYPLTLAGKKHAADYARGRAEGLRNFREIDAAERRGEDVTQDVLRRLVPHGNSEGNRQRGAWIHIAPAVTKDIQSWYEGAGWARKDDWPRVARAILNLVRKCAESAENLESACEEFDRSKGIKGLQTGLLTPILTCVRPDDYVVINNKVRKLIQGLTGSRPGRELSGYPDVNAMVHAMCTQMSDVFQKYPVGELSPTDAFDMMSHWFVAVRDAEGKTSYVKIAPGERGEHWRDWVQGGYAAIGWGELGDLSEFDRKAFLARRDEMIARFDDWTKQGCDQVWRFRNLEEGDVLIANRGTREVLGVGRVAGPYYYQKGTPLPHRVPVDWHDTRVRPVDQAGWRRTLVVLKAENAKAIIGNEDASVTTEKDGDGGRPVVGIVSPPVVPPYPLEECSNETGIPLETLERWVRAINRKGQAILYGPPGTGKTFVAGKLAKHFIGGGAGRGFYEVLQFHPSYAYEDFMQGIRPVVDEEGRLTYKTVHGGFYEFCKKAEEAGDDPCVLIIDEINRANLSRVFGELMYLLEYRDQSVRLAGGGKFQIPKNVVLLGTMNTADRSIALVDHALRRRFAFLPLWPDYELLRRKATDGNRGVVDRLTDLLKEINGRIQDPNYELGITFFLDPNLDKTLGDIWKMEIEPYLEEYFFNTPEVVAEYRWAQVEGRLLS